MRIIGEAQTSASVASIPVGKLNRLLKCTSRYTFLRIFDATKKQNKRFLPRLCLSQRRMAFENSVFLFRLFRIRKFDPISKAIMSFPQTG